MKTVTIRDLSKQIEDKELQKTSLDLDFGSDYLIQIINDSKYLGDSSKEWRVANAIDGYGRNCREEFINEKVIIV